MRVLIAEDDPIARKLLEKHLTRWGHEVVTCSDGAQAWDALQDEDAPKLLILDWVMPKIDGVRLCRKIRKIEKQPYIYIILLTAKDSTEDLINGLEAGADDYIAKPFDPHELKVRVRAGSRVLRLQEDLLEALKASEFQASHDSLTSLWNRAAALDTLHRELARSKREGSSVGVIIADVDHFKQINDAHGHLAGDAALREVARRMIASTRPYDSVGRYGGEEFIVVLPGTNLHSSGLIAERLRASFSDNPLKTDEGAFRVTISLGVAAFDTSSDWDVDSLIRAADAALYKAKNRGRNRVEVWEGGPPEVPPEDIRADVHR